VKHKDAGIEGDDAVDIWLDAFREESLKHVAFGRQPEAALAATSEELPAAARPGQRCAGRDAGIGDGGFRTLLRGGLRTFGSPLH
jgi:hypothetical protein